MWVKGKGWVEIDVERSGAMERQLYLKYWRAIHNKDRQAKNLTSVGGCVSKPLLKVGDRYMVVVLCILHLLMCVGKYLMGFIRSGAKKLKPARRKKINAVLKRSKTGMTEGGVGALDGEETWNLLKAWAKLSKLLRVDVKTHKVVTGIYTLLCNMYSTIFNPKVLKRRKIARRFHAAIMPNVRSLWEARARDFFALGKGDKTPVAHNNFQWQAELPNPFKVCKKRICG